MAKTSKRRGSKPKRAKATRVRRFTDDQRITVLASGNPRRPKTVQHNRYDVILRHRNKTVGTFKEHGGDVTALRYAVHSGHVRVK